MTLDDKRPKKSKSQAHAEIANGSILDTSLIGAVNPFSTVQAVRLESVEMPKINLPKTIDDLAISLPGRATSATTLTSHVGFYGGTISRGERSVATPVSTPNDLGTLIRKARENLKMSQQSFADLAGVGRRFISELENGKPTLEFGKVLKVAHAAGISFFARQK